MDTRTKIIDGPQAATIAQQGATVVSGYFDPLTAGVAERLLSLKSPATPLLVLIRTAQDVILPARARAELIASLRCVDFVCDEPTDLMPDTRLEDEHRAGLRSLIQHVHARQQAKAGTDGMPSAKAYSQRA